MRECDVLVVDDSSANRDALVDLLEVFGLTTDTAVDGVDAIEALRSRVRPRVMLLDYRMPRMDGAATVSAIRADPELARLPIIMVTGVVGATPPDVIALVHKPYAPGYLVELVRKVAMGRAVGS